MSKVPRIAESDPRVQFLHGAERMWWDLKEEELVRTATAYIPYGCGYGTTEGKRNELCIFCGLPNAVLDYCDEFYEGRPVPDEDHVPIFEATLKLIAPLAARFHTLNIFNAGSFPEMPKHVQSGVVKLVAAHPTLQHLVIESRAQEATEERLALLSEILRPTGKRLTMRFGVETQDGGLRNRELRKGHGRKQLREVTELMHRFGVTAGAYIMLNPAPNLDPAWARDEGVKSIDWALGIGPDDLLMDEVYFRPTFVAPDNPLTMAWRNGQFQPASLWDTLYVLRQAVEKYGRRVHLLPFHDEPPFEAVSSNHIPRGIPQDLTGARGCDRAFHAMFQQFRETMDPAVLRPPNCACRPDWFQ